MVLSAKGTASRTSSGSSSRPNAPPSPLPASASATELSAYRFGEQGARSRTRKIARKMNASDIDAAGEVNPSPRPGVDLAEPRPTDAPPLAPAHGGAAQHVAGAPEAPGEKPGGTTVERWMLVGIVLTMVALPTLEAVVRKTGDVARHFGLGVTWSVVPG